MRTVLPFHKAGRSVLQLLLLLLMLGAGHTAGAQQLPPRPIKIFANQAQGLSFGAFYQGAGGGTVTISHTGLRSTTGSVVQVGMGFSYSPAIYEVEADLGTLISVMNGPDVSLTGSNGGSMTLQIGSASTGTSFISTAVPPLRTEVRIGGTLTVGSTLASPPGNYSGSFSVMFIQQ